MKSTSNITDIPDCTPVSTEILYSILLTIQGLMSVHLIHFILCAEAALVSIKES